MKKTVLFFFIIAALSFSGCSWFDKPQEMEKTAEQLVSEGSSAFASGDYEAAVKAYTDLKDWYPFSKYAILAELKIADAYYNLENYNEAIFAYEEFEKMHPKNEAVPYIVYRIGLCWFNQIDTIDRDNTPAKNSLAQFNRLMEQFPSSQYSQEAKEKIKACMDMLSAHELYVADFYMKTKKYNAALKRYEYLVKKYPGSKESKAAMTKIPKCRELANKK